MLLTYEVAAVLVGVPFLLFLGQVRVASQLRILLAAVTRQKLQLLKRWTRPPVKLVLQAVDGVTVQVFDLVEQPQGHMLAQLPQGKIQLHWRNDPEREDSYGYALLEFFPRGEEQPLRTRSWNVLLDPPFDEETFVLGDDHLVYGHQLLVCPEQHVGLFARMLQYGALVRRRHGIMLATHPSQD